MNLISTVHATRYPKLIKSQRLQNKSQQIVSIEKKISIRSLTKRKTYIKNKKTGRAIVKRGKKTEREKEKLPRLKHSTKFKQKSLKSKAIGWWRRGCGSDIGQKREGIIWDAVGRNPFRWKISLEGIIKMDRL